MSFNMIKLFETRYIALRKFTDDNLKKLLCDVLTEKYILKYNFFDLYASSFLTCFAFTDVSARLLEEYLKILNEEYIIDDYDNDYFFNNKKEESSISFDLKVEKQEDIKENKENKEDTYTITIRPYYSKEYRINRLVELFEYNYTQYKKFFLHYDLSKLDNEMKEKITEKLRKKEKFANVDITF